MVNAVGSYCVLSELPKFAYKNVGNRLQRSEASKGKAYHMILPKHQPLQHIKMPCWIINFNCWLAFTKFNWQFTIRNQSIETQQKL